MEFLSGNTPDFISPLLWPLNSPDLNPVDYEVWSVLQQRVYRSRIRDVDHLKQRLIKEWRCFDQNIIDRAVRQWRVRLRACIHANGGLGQVVHTYVPLPPSSITWYRPKVGDALRLGR